MARSVMTTSNVVQTGTEQTPEHQSQFLYNKNSKCGKLSDRKPASRSFRRTRNNISEGDSSGIETLLVPNANKDSSQQSLNQTLSDFDSLRSYQDQEIAPTSESAFIMKNFDRHNKLEEVCELGVCKMDRFNDSTIQQIPDDFSHHPSSPTVVHSRNRNRHASSGNYSFTDHKSDRGVLSRQHSSTLEGMQRHYKSETSSALQSIGEWCYEQIDSTVYNLSQIIGDNIRSYAEIFKAAHMNSAISPQQNQGARMMDSTGSHQGPTRSYNSSRRIAQRRSGTTSPQYVNPARECDIPDQDSEVISSSSSFECKHRVDTNVFSNQCQPCFNPENVNAEDTNIGSPIYIKEYPGHDKSIETSQLRQNDYSDQQTSPYCMINIPLDDYPVSSPDEYPTSYQSRRSSLLSSSQDSSTERGRNLEVAPSLASGDQVQIGKEGITETVGVESGSHSTSTEQPCNLENISLLPRNDQDHMENEGITDTVQVETMKDEKQPTEIDNKQPDMKEDAQPLDGEVRISDVQENLSAEIEDQAFLKTEAGSRPIGNQQSDSRSDTGQKVTEKSDVEVPAVEDTTTRSSNTVCRSVQPRTSFSVPDHDSSHSKTDLKQERSLYPDDSVFSDSKQRNTRRDANYQPETPATNEYDCVKVACDTVSSHGKKLEEGSVLRLPIRIQTVTEGCEDTNQFTEMARENDDFVGDNCVTAEKTEYGPDTEELPNGLEEQNKELQEPIGSTSRAYKTCAKHKRVLSAEDLKLIRDRLNEEYTSLSLLEGKLVKQKIVKSTQLVAINSLIKIHEKKDCLEKPVVTFKAGNSGTHRHTAHEMGINAVETSVPSDKGQSFNTDRQPDTNLNQAEINGEEKTNQSVANEKHHPQASHITELSYQVDENGKSNLEKESPDREEGQSDVDQDPSPMGLKEEQSQLNESQAVPSTPSDKYEKESIIDRSSLLKGVQSLFKSFFDILSRLIQILLRPSSIAGRGLKSLEQIDRDPDIDVKSNASKTIINEQISSDALNTPHQRKMADHGITLDSVIEIDSDPVGIFLGSFGQDVTSSDESLQNQSKMNVFEETENLQTDELKEVPHCSSSNDQTTLLPNSENQSQHEALDKLESDFDTMQSFSADQESTGDKQLSNRDSPIPSISHHDQARVNLPCESKAKPAEKEGVRILHEEKSNSPRRVIHIDLKKAERAKMGFRHRQKLEIRDLFLNRRDLSHGGSHKHSDDDDSISSTSETLLDIEKEFEDNFNGETETPSEDLSPDHPFDMQLSEALEEDIRNEVIDQLGAIENSTDHRSHELIDNYGLDDDTRHENPPRESSTVHDHRLSDDHSPISATESALGDESPIDSEASSVYYSCHSTLDSPSSCPTRFNFS